MVDQCSIEGSYGEILGIFWGSYVLLRIELGSIYSRSMVDLGLKRNVQGMLQGIGHLGIKKGVGSSEDGTMASRIRKILRQRV